MNLRQRSMLIGKQTDQAQTLKMFFTIGRGFSTPFWTRQKTFRDVIAHRANRDINPLGQFFNCQMRCVFLHGSIIHSISVAVNS